MGLQLKTLLKKIAGIFDSIDGLIRRFKAILLVAFAVCLLGKLDEISRQISLIDSSGSSVDLSGIERELNNIKDTIYWK